MIKHITRHLLVNVVLIVLAAVLFAIAFPNPLFRYGIPLAAFFCLIPVVVVIHRSAWYTLPFWGFFYYAVSYMLFNYWLAVFDPNAFLVVPVIYGVYGIVVFLCMKYVAYCFPNSGFFLQFLIWMAYEYLRIQGFLGYSFGVLGYAISFNTMLIQSADIFGIWGLCVLVAAPSFFIGNIIIKKLYSIKTLIRTFPINILGIGYMMFFIAILLYGTLARVDYSDVPTEKISLLQHVTDPWKGGVTAYKNSLRTLKALTNTVMQEENPSIVIWSETAFVPSIRYHSRYRENIEYVKLIAELKRFLKKYPDTYFVIGNSEGERIRQDDGTYKREDYNAVLLFKGNKRLDAYYKQHLVPFTEYFPYQSLFPWMYSFLEQSDTHFWRQGTKSTVFETEHVSFSTPVCFEDGFGTLNAQFVRGGADIIINVTNDAWSGVEINAMQHLQLSIIRAVENRRSVLRSTNSGMTAVIDPNGRILEMLPSFESRVITYDVPIYTKRHTVYTKYGDWFGKILLMMALICLLYGIIVLFKSKIYRKK